MVKLKVMDRRLIIMLMVWFVIVVIGVVFMIKLIIVSVTASTLK